MPSLYGPYVRAGSADLELRFFILASPRPGVAKPHRGQQMDLRGLGTTVADGDLDQDVLRLDLGILDEDIKVSVLVEDAGVEQFILGSMSVALPVVFDEGHVRILRLRILVEVLHIRVGGRVV